MTRIAILGGGNMGRSITHGLLNRSKLNVSIVVSDPAPEQRSRFSEIEVQTVSNNREALADVDVVILAVKPQVAAAVVKQIQRDVENKLVVSIVAGLTLKTLSQWLPPKTSIVRCMPNTPALIGAGITGLIKSKTVSNKDAKLVDTMMGSLGEVVWVKEDHQLDAITAISGSGPAYFFYLMEAMMNAGKLLKLEPEVVNKLVKHTAVGSSLLAHQSDLDPQTLRNQVTSPGGTTASAVSVLDKECVQHCFVAAIESAYKRSQELSEEFCS